MPSTSPHRVRSHRATPRLTPRHALWLRSIITLLLGSLLSISFAAHAQSFSWIKNRWKPDQYVHIETGAPQAGPIQPGWWSAMWVVEPVPGTEFVKLRNRWKGDQYLHIETGALESGPIQPGW